jgi:ankyrin repeat protein
MNKLIDASKVGDVNEVKRQIKKGVDLDIMDNDGNTALIWASRSNHGEVVKLLIEAGANLNIRDNWGDTALILISRWNQINIFPK